MQVLDMNSLSCFCVVREKREQPPVLPCRQTYKDTDIHACRQTNRHTDIRHYPHVFTLSLLVNLLHCLPWLCVAFLFLPCAASPRFDLLLRCALLLLLHCAFFCAAPSQACVTLEVLLFLFVFSFYFHRVGVCVEPCAHAEIIVCV